MVNALSNTIRTADNFRANFDYTTDNALNSARLAIPFSLAGTDLPSWAIKVFHIRHNPLEFIIFPLSALCRYYRITTEEPLMEDISSYIILIWQPKFPVMSRVTHDKPPLPRPKPFPRDNRPFRNICISWLFPSPFHLCRHAEF